MRSGLVVLAVAAVVGVGATIASAQTFKRPSCRTPACLAAQQAAADKARLDAKTAVITERRTNKAAAENKRQMDAEIAANKAIAAKRAAEPGVTKQTCNMINGQLICR